MAARKWARHIIKAQQHGHLPGLWQGASLPAGHNTEQASVGAQFNLQKRGCPGDPPLTHILQEQLLDTGLEPAEEHCRVALAVCVQVELLVGAL